MKTAQTFVPWFSGSLAKSLVQKPPELLKEKDSGLKNWEKRKEKAQLVFSWQQAVNSDLCI